VELRVSGSSGLNTFQGGDAGSPIPHRFERSATGMWVPRPDLLSQRSARDIRTPGGGREARRRYPRNAASARRPQGSRRNLPSRVVMCPRPAPSTARLHPECGPRVATSRSMSRSGSGRAVNRRGVTGCRKLENPLHPVIASSPGRSRHKNIPYRRPTAHDVISTTYCSLCVISRVPFRWFPAVVFESLTLPSVVGTGPLQGDIPEPLYT
jgi:hypothetical protein